MSTAKLVKLSKCNQVKFGYGYAKNCLHKYINIYRFISANLKCLSDLNDVFLLSSRDLWILLRFIGKPVFVHDFFFLSKSNSYVTWYDCALRALYIFVWNDAEKQNRRQNMYDYRKTPAKLLLHSAWHFLRWWAFNGVQRFVITCFQQIYTNLMFMTSNHI